MDEAESAAELLRRWQGGDARAAELLVARYARCLTRLAEQHLSRQVAARVDSEDVVQSVFRTFFRRSAAGEFRIDGSARLWRLLVTITVRKAGALVRRHTAEVRDVRAEAPGGDLGLAQAVARDPGPAEAAALVDQIDALVRDLPPLYCHVLERRLQGHSVADIADGLGVSRQTIYRALELLQQRLAASEAAV